MLNDSQQKISSPEPLFQMILGGWVQQSISVAAKLGITDILNEGPKSHEELAGLTNTHAPTIYRLMRALSSVGLFKELEKSSSKIVLLIGTLEQTLMVL